MVERSDVVAAYRFLLRRNPENEAVISEHMRIGDWQTLRTVFLESEEYRTTTPFHHAAPDHLAQKMDVDVLISDQQFARLLAHIRSSWEAMGRERPHWSVLTADRFLPENLASNAESFFDSGAFDAERFYAAVERAGVSLRPGTCLELGCGVGRVTRYLAQRFEKVIGFDVSAPHLEIARDYLGKSGVTNVELVLLQSVDDLLGIDNIDAVYSLFVLQHNPPPIMRALLANALARLGPAGLAFFQIPVYGAAYRFKIEDYLRELENQPETMEMHVLPQRHLCELLAERKMTIRDLIYDGDYGGPWVMHQYLTQRTD